MGSHTAATNNKIATIRDILPKHGIDCVLIPLGINFRWTFGILEEPSERLVLAILTPEASPIIVAPAFEVDRMKRATGISEVIGWEELQDPYTMVPNLVGKCQKIAVDPKMWFSVYSLLTKTLPKNTEIVSAAPIFDAGRAIKDETEQKAILKASQKTGDAIVKTLEELEPGITEAELQKILVERLTWGSREKTFSLVQFGDNSALPHYHGGERRLRNDDVVLIDAGGTLNNYWGDITMTTVFGKASQRFKEIYDIVFKANTHGKDTVIKGKLPYEIDNRVRDYISSKGYGQYFTHRTGHGLGLEVHEHPYIVGTNRFPLSSGNVFTIEPGIYLPNEFGVRIEDNVIKTADGILTSDIPRYEMLEV
ncbi:MAG: M24 family metallopeptidase [Candidatus Heimdallarchaeota archaeon]